MKFFMLVILFLPFVFAEPVGWFNSAFVTIGLNVSSSVALLPVGSSPVVDSLKVDVVFVPRNSDFSAVRSFDAFPSAVYSSDRVVFEWSAPAQSVSYGYSSVVENANSVPHVYASIPFPTKFPSALRHYTLPSKTIDAGNPAIIAQSALLARDEDDLFLLVSKIAFWVNDNINYNLSTLTAEVSQPASWVLKNRQGVCDEITSLFIAMLRSLKIPARFVSGVAFTNSPDFSKGWGAHGWAEVYFPGVGWVPFDPTFGEFGWIDPGHIKLKESIDPQEPTTFAKWRSRDVDVKLNELNISAGVLGFKGRVPPELLISVSPLHERVGLGSYTAVLADVENLADYYVSARLSLNPVNDMAIIGSEFQTVVFPPHGRARLFWKVKVSNILSDEFQYEMPLVVYDVKNNTARSFFVVSKWDVVYSLASVDSSLSQFSSQQSEPFRLSCALEADFVLADRGRVDCSVRNLLESSLDVSVCFADCQVFSLSSKSVSPVSFDVPLGRPGPKDVIVSASSGSFSRRAVLTIVRLDTPEISVKDFVFPSLVSYGDVFSVKFLLFRESVSSPKNVSVRLSGGGISSEVYVGDLLANQEVVVNILSSQLYSSSPDFSVFVVYYDDFGSKFSSKSAFSVEVLGVPWYKRIVGFLLLPFVYSRSQSNLEN